MLYRLHPDYPDLFPDPEEADADGLVAVGGDLSVRRLLAAYASGLFPWYSEGQPLLWWSPDPRCVIYPERFRIPHTVRKEIRTVPFTVTHDCAFRAVMERCARIPRSDQNGTWITDEMIEAYVRLHNAGFAHSVEIWEEDGDSLHNEKDTDSELLKKGKMLVGGLYGVRIGGVFFGESMFHSRSHASKVALVSLMQQLVQTDCRLVDCQMQTAHIMRYGAECIPRRCFLQQVRELIFEEGRLHRKLPLRGDQ